jgi:hypothetical protein
MEGRVQKPVLKLITATLAISALVAHAQEGDADFKTEERFHNVYKKYNEQPTSGEAWEKVLSDRKANSYAVQDKDTLWDISNTLFGDAHYWPKVWSYNTEDILNPHQINPKQQIKFYAGTLEEAPTVGLADKTDAPEDLPKHVIEKKDDGSITLEGVKIPPPKRKSRPLVRNLPKSLPLYRLGRVNEPKVDFEVSGARVKHLPAPKYLSHYAVDIAPTTIGEIVEMERPDEMTTGDYQYVIVRISNPGVKHLVAYSDNTKIFDPTELFANKAIMVEVQGEVELGERVNEGENLFRATVKKSINPLEVGAKLMEGRISTFDTAPTTVTTSVQAKIIGGEYQRFEQKMFGPDNFVFLSAGAKEGLQEGSTLQIFMNERLRKAKTKAIDNDRVIGTVKVIKNAEHFATGYVLDTSTDIMIGDYAGGRVKSTIMNDASASAASSEDADAMAPPVDNGSSNGNDDLKFDDSPPTIEDGPNPAPSSPEDDFQL